MASSNKNKTLARKNTANLKDAESPSDPSDSDDSSYSSSSAASATDTDGRELEGCRTQAVKQQPTSKVTTSVCQERCEDPSPVALLDMLAEVASATLKSDPMIMAHRAHTKLVSPEKKPKKAAKRKLSPPPPFFPPVSKDMLSLDQIRMLSDKLLVNMFSEMTSDEIRRVYTYTCHLLPDKCHHTYSSFGNENKARMQMKTHLLGHIAQLLAEANTPGKSQRAKFSAEPLPARKKRLAAEKARRSRVKVMKSHSRNTRLRPMSSKPKVSPGPLTIELPVNIKNKQHTSTKSFKYSSSSSNDAKNDVMDKKKLVPTKSVKLDNHSNNAKAILSSKGSSKIHDVTNPLKDKNMKFNGMVKLSSSKVKRKNLKKRLIEGTVNMVLAARERKHGQTSRPLMSKKDLGMYPMSEKTEKCKNKVSRENDFSENAASLPRLRRDSIVEVVDTLAQPLHDHCYTSLSGKKVEMYYDDLDMSVHPASDEENDESTTHSCSSLSSNSYVKGVPSDAHNSQNFVSFTTMTHIPSPALPVPMDPSIGAIEVISYDIQPASSEKKGGSYNEKECHLKPKRIRRINRIIVPEEFETESSDDEAENVCESIPKPLVIPLPPPSKVPSCIKKKVPVEGSPEWERKLALKYIRMLRAKKKDERVALICKICKDKSFTAQATLMYHYRSHAGIKPFVCDICSTTFTRQHSLNYHMLIHNNKSRFTCIDCGRKFRHPSHFKEHMRRHTGETPFECADCGLRFKTRNTYKRHLKTRHGKLLTANGIMVLSSEEFLKVKTNPRKKVSRRKDKETQCPEVSLNNPSPRSSGDSSAKSSPPAVKSMKIPAILRNSRGLKVTSNEAGRSPVESGHQNVNGKAGTPSDKMAAPFSQIKMEVIDDGYETAGTSKCYKMCMIGTT